MKLATDILFVGIVMAAAWPLSAWDQRVTGEDRHADLLRRAERCGITLVLLVSSTLNGYFAIFIFSSIAIYWAGTISEFLAEKFHGLIDSQDHREFDAKHAERDLDLLSKLIREGRTREALDLGLALEQSGQASPSAVDALLHHFYLELLNSSSRAARFAEIRRLRDAGQFAEAEARLKGILAAQPEDSGAILWLIRLYAEDLKQPGLALALLESANQRPCLHKALAKYARESIGEWISPSFSEKISDPASSAATATVQAPTRAAVREVSLDELLKDGQLTTAIELLEKITREEPGNFDAWMKLAETYGIHCADLNRAGKIIRTMELSSNFTPQEIERARAKLREWREVRR